MADISETGRVGDTLEREHRDTAELLERERDLRRRLESEGKVRDRLVALLAGELVAHANIVLGWSEMMRREPLDGGARDIALQKIESSAHAQLATVEDLVDLDAIANGTLRLECGAADLVRIIRDVALEAGERKIVVDEGAPTTAFVFADRAQILRIMRALLPTSPDAEAAVFRIGMAEDQATVSVRVVRSRVDARNDLHVARELVQVYGGSLRIADDGSAELTLPTCDPPWTEPAPPGSASDVR